jgi:hypothetical protein
LEEQKAIEHKRKFKNVFHQVSSKETFSEPKPNGSKQGSPAQTGFEDLDYTIQSSAGKRDVIIQ